MTEAKCRYGKYATANEPLPQQYPCLLKHLLPLHLCEKVGKSDLEALRPKQIMVYEGHPSHLGTWLANSHRKQNNGKGALVQGSVKPNNLSLSQLVSFTEIEMEL